MWSIVKRIFQPLASRKMRVALAAVIAAFAAEFGVQAGEPLILTILGVAAALILGIAIEDHAVKSRVELPQADRE